MPFKPGQSGNPKGKKRGTLAKRTMALDAVKSVYGSEQAFWIAVATQAKDGDLTMAKELMARLQPTLKATSAPITLELPDFDNTADVVPVVVRAIGSGAIPADDGATLLSALLSGSKLEKLEALETKVDELLGQRQ